MEVILFFCSLLFATPAFADPGFDEKYERDYNIFNPASKYAPDNPLNPARPMRLTIPLTLQTAMIPGTQ